MFNKIGTTVLSLAAGAAFAGTVTFKDYTGRGFAPDRVFYRITRAEAGNRAQDAQGRPVPVQVVDGVDGLALCFVAEVPPGGESTYTLDPAGPVAPAGAWLGSDGRDKETLVLSNAFLAVKMPAIADTVFEQAVPAQSLPAPVLAFRGKDGAWLGEGSILSRLPVRRFTVRRTAAGPVFAEILYRLEFEGGGFYQAAVRVTDRSPLADITEEYDLGWHDDTQYWQLSLSKGWTPDAAEFMTAMGQGVAPITRPTLAELEGKIPPGVNGWDLPNQDAVGEMPVRLLFPEGWGARFVSYFGVHRQADRAAASNDYPLAMVAMLHKGNWRRPNSIPVLVKGGDVRLCFPMAVKPQSWLSETGSDVSPFSCHEHDPALPATYGRRQWGLLLAHPALRVKGAAGEGPGYSACNLYGTVGLDRYKDYVLAWPDTKPAYPRVFLRTNDVERFRAALTNAADAPLARELKKYVWFQPEASVAAAELKQLEKTLDEAIAYIATSLAIGHHHTYHYADITAHADSVLAWPDLSAADRERLRAKLALMACLMVEPDVMSHGTGSHHGNPNMGVSRQMDMLNLMALLPDHPMHVAWRDYMGLYMAYKTGSFMAPGGGWFEYGSSYHMHGYGKILRGLMGLYASGAPQADLMRAYHRQDFDYFLNLLSPVDPRYGCRLVPGNANSSRGCCPEYLMAMGTFADTDPAFAANLRWAWEANGRFMNGLAVPAMARPWIPAKEPELSSRAYPGFGVIFRAHPGPDETYLFFRSGYLWSHWPVDQGHLFLYSKKAPLIPDQPYQYYSHSDRSFAPYNLIRFGAASNEFPHAWPDSNILDYRFGGTVEYAWSSSGYPDWYNTPGAARGWEALNRRPLEPGLEQKPGAFTWDRQVVFLKGPSGSAPNYFVIRDSTRGPGALARWFNLNLLGRKTNVTVKAGTVAVDTEWPASLDVLFPGRDTLAVDMHEEDTAIQYGPYNKVSRELPRDQPLSRDWLAKGGALATLTNPPAVERQVQLRLQGRPDEDFAWVLYPRQAGEAAAKAERLASGVVKVTTPGSVDYVFVSPTNFTYEGEGVSFSGSVGSVRVGRESVTLALLAGSGRVGYKGAVVSGGRPFEKIVKAADLKPGSETVPAVASDSIPDGPAVSEGAAGIRFIEPERRYVELARGAVGVKGMGPFDLTFTPDGITGRVDGDLRTLVCTWPERITRPMYRQDGVRYYAGFGDEHSIVKGTDRPQFSLAFGVSAGPHAVEVSEWTWPAMPPAPARRGL